MRKQKVRLPICSGTERGVVWLKEDEGPGRGWQETMQEVEVVLWRVCAGPVGGVAE